MSKGSKKRKSTRKKLKLHLTWEVYAEPMIIIRDANNDTIGRFEMAYAQLAIHAVQVWNNDDFLQPE
jgi:hypothetical protein